MKIQWTKDKVNVLKAYLESGLSYREIGQKMGLSYKQIANTVARYGIRSNIETTPLLKKESSKLKKEDITTLARMIGENLYQNYKKVKLVEPTPIKCLGKREETSILDISDVHIGMINRVFDSDVGKQVITYNMDVFQKELNNLYQSVTEIHSILRTSYNLKELVIFSLGDIVTNDRIFEGQTLEIEKVVGLQVWDAINYFTAFFNNLLKIYEHITIVGVVGNHGRSLPDYHDECVQNNFEYFIYKTWEKQFADSKRVTVIVPETHRYIHKIYGWKHLIEHGDSIRGAGDAGLEKQVKDLSINVGGFDVMHLGHFHKLREKEIGDKIIVKQNGSWIPKDDFSFKKWKTYSVPKQYFFGCNKHRPETWNFKLDLRG